MTQTVLDQIGGEDALRELVEHFYDLVEELPEGQLSPYSVVEVRWSVVLSDRLEGCPL